LRVFVSADIEGVAGVSREEQTVPGSPSLVQSCRLLTCEVNAAVQGAQEAGADEVVVSDGHWYCTNLLPEELHPLAELVNGYPRALNMAAGLGAGFDAAFFVGYHASAGTPCAVLDHTYADSRAVLQVRLNGAPQSEGSLTGYLCGLHGCPVALFTGDTAAVAEMHRFSPKTEGVVVKDGIGRQAARSLHPTVARQRINEGARRALERLPEIPPMRLDGRCELEIDFLRAEMADSCRRVPGVTRPGPRTVGWAGEDYASLYELFLVLVELAEAIV
jgi:D-amino peptidase